MLTLQIYIDNTWQDAATVTFPYEQQGDLRRCRIEYLTNYLVNYYGRVDNAALSVDYPVEITSSDRTVWPRFFDDILPSGASRRFWVSHHQLNDYADDELDLVLLERAVIAPVGNVRVKNALIELENSAKQLTFSQADVADRNADFLEYAIDRGAIAGGATGAGGEAPKLLVRQSPAQDVWIDTLQTMDNTTDTYYLVKFPRNQRQSIDCDILRAEKYFYEELHALGVNTVSVQGLKLVEGELYPSLWIPRFDVDEHTRNGLESLYAVLDVPPGTALRHETVIAALHQRHQHVEAFLPGDFSQFVIEWVKRDLLNIIFGNSDNHGRNTSFLKKQDRITLAPVYDFAPMKADPEGIVRTLRWQQGEYGGQFDFRIIAAQLENYVAPEQLLSELKKLGLKLIGLRERLIQRGVPQRIIDFPAISFTDTEQKLKNWNVL